MVKIARCPNENRFFFFIFCAVFCPNSLHFLWSQFSVSKHFHHTLLLETYCRFEDLIADIVDDVGEYPVLDVFESFPFPPFPLLPPMVGDAVGTYVVGAYVVGGSVSGVGGGEIVGNTVVGGYVVGGNVVGEYVVGGAVNLPDFPSAPPLPALLSVPPPSPFPDFASAAPPPFPLLPPMVGDAVGTYVVGAYVVGGSVIDVGGIVSAFADILPPRFFVLFFLLPKRRIIFAGLTSSDAATGECTPLQIKTAAVKIDDARIV